MKESLVPPHPSILPFQHHISTLPSCNIYIPDNAIYIPGQDILIYNTDKTIYIPGQDIYIIHNVTAQHQQVTSKNF